jgi:hypothetical protein
MKKAILAAIIAGLAINPAFAGEYTVRKAVLGTYNANGKGTMGVSWSYVKNHEISLDEDRNIYVLDRVGKRVLKFNSEGKHLNDVRLKDVDFKDKSEEEGDDGYIAFTLKTSADGNKFYVTEGGRETNWAVIGSDGNPIKKNMLRNFYWIQRICNSNNFRSVQDKSVINANLDTIKTIPAKLDKNKTYVLDSSDNLYFTERKSKPGRDAVVGKSTAEGKVLWKKEIKGCKNALRFIGGDGQDNVYLLADTPLRIIKLDKDGNSLAEIPVPSEAFFKKWEMVDWYVLCDGTICCIPYYWALFNSNKGRRVNEFAVYYFEHK